MARTKPTLRVVAEHKSNTKAKIQAVGAVLQLKEKDVKALREKEAVVTQTKSSFLDQFVQAYQRAVIPAEADYSKAMLEAAQAVKVDVNDPNQAWQLNLDDGTLTRIK